jgi:hypothetical protein
MFQLGLLTIVLNIESQLPVWGCWLIGVRRLPVNGGPSTKPWLDTVEGESEA